MDGLPEVSPRATRLAFDPSLIGAFYCLSAAVLYAAVNVCLRGLSVECDPFWAIGVKESVSVAVAGPLVLLAAWRGQPVLPPRREIVVLILAGLATQLGGNLAQFWAFGVVGLAVTIPVILGVNLVVAALLGWWLLGERVSARAGVAIGLLIVAIVLLSRGAVSTSASIAAASQQAIAPWKVWAGIAAACGAGTIYAGLNIAIRSTVTGSTRPLFVVLTITGMGVLTLVPLSLVRHGMTALLATPPQHVGAMLLAGLLNLLAFAGITKGLQRTSVVHANAIAASQTAMAAVAGMFLFAEPATPTLVLGVGLTVAGMMSVKWP